MKKVTFILDKLVMGGTEQAFLRLVKYIDREKFDINLILLRQGGELEQFLPDYVKVEYAKTRLLKDSLKHFRILEFFWGIYCRIRIRNAKNDFEDSLYNYKVRTLPESLNAESIICFFSSGFLCKMMAAYSKSNRKIFWVHSIMKETYRDEQYLNIMNHFDYICCASLAMKEDFCRRFPMLADKTMVIYNIIDENNIRQKAEEVISEKLESVSLMTVGRLSEEKGQLIIPAVTRKLLDRDYIVYWYLIGGGSLEERIRTEIKKYHVEDHVHLMGVKNNPYPYIKKCDIYVQPSIQEGFGLTVQEAKILAKPIVATNISAFREQITDGENGILTERDSESMAKAIAKLIDNKKLIEKLTDNLSSYHFDIENEMEKIYRYVLQ